MHPILRARAEQQLGLFTAADARRAGYEHSEIRALRRSGAWVRLRRGVHTTSEVLDRAGAGVARHRIDCMAVLLELGRPTSVVSHASAARLHGCTAARPAAAPRLRELVSIAGPANRRFRATVRDRGRLQAG
jgi:hypothetical protein